MKIPKTRSRSNVHHADVIRMYVLDNILRVLCLPADGRKCCTATAGAAEEDREGGVGWLAKWVSAMSNNLAISSTGFKGGPPSGEKAVFIHSMRSLNAAIVPAPLNVSCRVKRGPPDLGFFAWGAATANTHKNATSALRN